MTELQTPNPARQRWLLGWLCACTVALFACRPEAPPAHRGPVVLITLDALRADAVGALGGPSDLTPHLDALAAESTWAGRGITSSSWTVPSMASIFTGLQPWRHGNWHGGRTVLAETLLTLPEALHSVGFHTAGFRSNHWLQEKFGYKQGFDRFGYLRQGQRAVAHLASLEGGADFVWAHILPPHAPYHRWQKFLDRLPTPAEELPERLKPVDLEPYYDPAIPLPADARERAWALYLLNVAWADEMLGLLVDGLKRSGQWDRTLLIVTSDHGEEFGEDGQILHGGNLHRALLEVPLFIKLPAAFPRQLALPEGQAVANLRTFATIVEAVGAPLPEGVAASFFTASEEPILSELYNGNGTNEFSLLVGDRQVRWLSRFAAGEKDYYRARLSSLGRPPAEGLDEEPGEIFARLDERFAQSLPLTGAVGSPPRFSLWRWLDDGVELIVDPDEAERLARRLRRVWQDLNGDETLPPDASVEPPELSPEDEEALRALGYIAG